jgi:hypothetical protein
VNIDKVQIEFEDLLNIFTHEASLNTIQGRFGDLQNHAPSAICQQGCWLLYLWAESNKQSKKRLGLD